MPKEKEKKDDGKVYIGAKPLINYIQAITFQLERQPEVIVASRGKFTARALDVVEIAKHKYNVVVKEIKTDSEDFEVEGKQLRVTTIEIRVIKK